MSMNGMMQDDRIAALATPLGESALAVIRTSGEGTLQALSRGFSRPGTLQEAPGNTIIYGWLQYDESRRVDEVTVAVFRAPRSYTGEESAEIYCHGSIPGIQKIMELLFTLGFRQAEPGEFSLRAFINGKMDLTRAEAVHEIVRSQSRKAQSLALNRLSGRVFEEIDRVKSRLVDIMAAVSVQLDYPDDELPGEDDDSGYVRSLIPMDTVQDAVSGLERLVSSYRSGRLYQQGARVALAGQTNAGKSSMFNLFLKEDRSIVSNIHGTTRDYIQAPVVLDGIPLSLYDTAGLREVDEIIEKEGIRRSGQVIENSSVILYLVDGTNSDKSAHAFDEKQLERIGELNLPCVKIWTKTDLPQCAPAPKGFLPLSMISGEGFDRVQQAMMEALLQGERLAGDGDLVIDSLRQKQLIDDALDGLQQALTSMEGDQPLDIIAMDLQRSIRSLGEITGEVSSEDILDRVFSGFCVGK